MHYDIRRFASAVLGIAFHEEAKEYTGNCPFHNDIHPSFSFSADGRFCCQACGVKGSLIDFAVRYYALDDELVALDKLYPYSQYQDASQIEQKTSQEERVLRQQLNREAAQRYYDRIYQDKSVITNFHTVLSKSHEYLFRRGFLQETLEHFHVAIWEIFYDRPILIPCAMDGIAYGYVQRAISDRIRPKYLTMIGMVKSEHVYGEKNESRIGLLTEGYTDIMMAWQYGWEWGLYTILGKSISTYQMAELASYCDDLYVGFDMDDAGEEGYKGLLLQQKLHYPELHIHRLHFPAKDIALCTRRDFQQVLKLVQKPV